MVIPCHNSLRWLPETLDAVLAQRHEDFEVLLVDDGGTDDLAAWAAEVGDHRVRVVRQDNAGVAAARNRGVAEARGELVAFCDSDDVWLPHTLEALVERFDRDPGVGLVYGWYDVVSADGRPTGRVEAHRIEGEVWERLVTTNPVGMSATLVPRSVFATLGGFAVHRAEFPVDVEDWEMWIRIADSHRVAVVPEVLYHHRRHDSNSSAAVDSLERAYRRLLRGVFEGQPESRRRLRPRAVAHAELILAWQSLNDDRDARRALALRRSAVTHDPSRARSLEYWRLGAAATVMATLGRSIYELVRAGAGAARRGLGLRRG